MPPANSATLKNVGGGGRSTNGKRQKAKRGKHFHEDALIPSSPRVQSLYPAKNAAVFIEHRGVYALGR